MQRKKYDSNNDDDNNGDNDDNNNNNYNNYNDDDDDKKSYNNKNNNKETITLHPFQQSNEQTFHQQILVPKRWKKFFHTIKLYDVQREFLNMKIRF